MAPHTLILLILLSTTLLNATTTRKTILNGEYSVRKQSSLYKNPIDLLCPSNADISPCECHSTSEDGIILVCNEIEDEEELGRVFQAHFPVTHINSFRIWYAEGIEYLNSGVFGEVTFESVEIVYSGLSYIENEVLSNSNNTLRELDISFNKINNSFDFSQIEDLSNLKNFYIGYNQVTDFPILKSLSLVHLSLSGNPIKDLPDNALNNVPNIVTLDLSNCLIEELPKRIFYNQPNLNVIELGYNLLTHISRDQFAFNNSSIQSIWLNNNAISSIEEDAFSGISNTTLELTFNNIQTLDEHVYRKLLDNNVELALDGNPLQCECDAAWIVLNSVYHNLVRRAFCKNGVNLVYQDPTWYNENC